MCSKRKANMTRELLKSYGSLGNEAEDARVATILLLDAMNSNRIDLDNMKWDDLRKYVLDQTIFATDSAGKSKLTTAINALIRSGLTVKDFVTLSESAGESIARGVAGETTTYVNALLIHYFEFLSEK